MDRNKLILLSSVILLTILLPYVVCGYEEVAYGDSTLLSISNAAAVFADLHSESEGEYEGNGGWETLNDIYGAGYYADDDTAAVKSVARRVIAYIQASY